MVTDNQARRLKKMLSEGNKLSTSALKTGMDEKYNPPRISYRKNAILIPIDYNEKGIKNRMQMSRKRKVYSTEFKTKLVLEVVNNDKTLKRQASSNNITPKNLQNWKRTFLDNAEIAMEPARASEYKNAIKELEVKNDQYAKIVGKLTVERDWLSKKVKSLGLSKKESLMEPKLNNLSIIRQCELIKLNRSNLYYKAGINQRKEDLLEHINSIYKEVPIYESSQSTSAVTIGWL